MADDELSELADSIRDSYARRRAKHDRRRRIDPTTFDREYTAEEMEFMRAMQAYKQSSGRMFPTWSEVLKVLRSLGYEKVDRRDADGESVVEFVQAMQAYKQSSGRMFPTWSEVLEVLQNLGYQRAGGEAHKDTQSARSALTTATSEPHAAPRTVNRGNVIAEAIGT